MKAHAELGNIPQTRSSSWIPHPGDNPTVSQVPDQMSGAHPPPSSPLLTPPQAPVPIPILCPHRSDLAQASSHPTQTLALPLLRLLELLFILTRNQRLLPHSELIRPPHCSPAPQAKVQALEAQ